MILNKPNVYIIENKNKTNCFTRIKNTSIWSFYLNFKKLVLYTILGSKKCIFKFKIFVFEYLSISSQIFISKIFAYNPFYSAYILKKKQDANFFKIKKVNEKLFLTKIFHKFPIKVENYILDLGLAKKGKHFRKKTKPKKIIFNEINKNRKKKKQNCWKKSENIIYETRKNLSMRNIYCQSIPEYSQIKGWFDAKKTRIKNFCDFWDEAIWIFHKFFTEKYFVNKKYSYLKEQLFFSFLFCQTNKNDMCGTCINIRNFPYNEKVLLIYPSFLCKILFFDEKWNQITSEFKEKFIKTIHAGLSIDVSFDNLILERCENTIEHFSKQGIPIYDIPIIKNLDFFANCIAPKSYFLILLKEKSNSFNLIFQRSCLKTSINLLGFYSKWHKKCSESFFPGIFETMSFFIFLVSKKIYHLNNYKKPIKNFLLQLFKKKYFYEWKKARNDFFDEIYNKKFLNYKNYKNEKKRMIYSQTDIFLTKFFFKKAKNILDDSKFLNKIGKEKDYFENFILIISFKKIFLMVILKNFKKKIEKKRKKISINKTTLQLMKLFNSQDFYPFENKNYGSNLKSHRLCLINLQKKNQKNEFSENCFFISFGTISEINNVKQHKISIDKQRFSKLIIMLCANFGVNFLFFLISDSFEWEIVQILKNIVFNLRENIQSKYQDEKKQILKNFLEKLKIISFGKDSINYQLSKTLNAKTLSNNKFKNLLCATILLLDKGIYSLSWFLTLKKKEKVIKFNKIGKKIQPSMIKELLNLLMKLKVQEFFLDSEHFYPDKNKFFLLRYNCSYGLRKTNDFFQHINEDNDIISNKVDKIKKNKYKNGNFGDSTNYFNNFKDIIFIFHNKTRENKFAGGLYVHMKKLIDYKRVVENNYADLKLFLIKNETQNCFFKKIYWKEKKSINIIENVSPLKIFLFKNYRVSFELNYEIFQNYFIENFIENYIFNQKNNIFLKKWEEIFQEKNRIGQILFNKASKKGNNFHVQGLTNNFFKYFIHKKDCFDNPLKFEKLILRKIKNFPGKIFSMYSKINQVRLILATRA